MPKAALFAGLWTTNRVIECQVRCSRHFTTKSTTNTKEAKEDQEQDNGLLLLLLLSAKPCHRHGRGADTKHRATRASFFVVSLGGAHKMLATIVVLGFDDHDLPQHDSETNSQAAPGPCRVSESPG